MIPFRGQAGEARGRGMGVVITLGVLLVTGWMMAQWILSSRDPTMVLGGLVLIGGTIVLATLINWRLGLHLFLIWLLFEDLARKYMGNNMLIYFGKDVLVAACLMSFLFALKRGEAKLLRLPRSYFLLMFLWLGILQLFNPNSTHVVYGLLGLKLYFYYIPLMFLGFALIESHQDLQRFLLMNLAVAGVIATLGSIQGVVGLDFLTPQQLAPEIADLGRLTRVAPISGRLVARPTGVFVSDGRFGWYVLMMWIVALGAIAYLLMRRRRSVWPALVAAAVVFNATVLSGSRGVFVYSLASLLLLAGAFLWGSVWETTVRKRLVSVVALALTAAGVAMLAAVLAFPGALADRWAFYSESLALDSSASQLIGRAWDYPIGEFLKAFSFPDWWLGYGIGSASLGAQYVSRLLGVPPPGVGVESGFGVLLLELGPLGPVLWILWAVSLLSSGWKVLRSLRGTSLFPLGASLLWFVFLVLFPFTYGSIVAYQNFVLNAYLWLFVGVLFRLQDLAMQERVAPVVARTGGHDR